MKEQITEKILDQEFAIEVATAILNWPVNAFVTLTPPKLAEKFAVPLTDLEIAFEKGMEKALDKFILIRKMFVALSFMRSGNNNLTAKTISKILGYKKYADFVAEFKATYRVHPQYFVKDFKKQAQKKQLLEETERALLEIYLKSESREEDQGNAPRDDGKYYMVRKFFPDKYLKEMVKNKWIDVSETEIILTETGREKAAHLFKMNLK